MDYRDIQAPATSLSPKDLPDDGAAGVHNQLANAFKDFAGKSQDVADTLFTKQGAQDGAKAGAMGDGGQKTGLGGITPYGLAYNRAATITYTNGVQTAIETQIGAAETDHAADPTTFSAVAQAARDAAVKAAPPEIQPHIAQMYNARIAAGFNRVYAQADAQTKNDAFASYTSTVDSRITAALQTSANLPDDQAAAVTQRTIDDNKAQLDGLVQSRALTPEHAAILQKKFAERYDQLIDGQHIATRVNDLMTLARGNVETGDAALAKLQSDPSLSQDDKDAIRAQYQKDRDAWTWQQSRTHSGDLANLAGRLAQGDFGSDVIGTAHDLYKQGAMTPEQLSSHVAENYRNQAKAIDDSADIALVQQALNGGHGLDPKNKDQANAASKWWDANVAQANETPGSDAYNAHLVSFYKATNVVPQSAQSWLRIGLLSGDPSQAALAAATSKRLQDANPTAAPYENDPKLSVLSTLINDNLATGMPVVQAYQYARAQTDQTPEQKKLIEQTYGKQKYADTNLDALRSTLKTSPQISPHWYSGLPAEPPISMQAEYEQLVRQNFGYSQNIDTARAVAGKQILQQWGATRMNGTPELVKYPPENAGISPAIIRQDVATSAAGAGYTGDPTQIRLVPIPDTNRTQGRVWGLEHVAPDGTHDVLLDSKNRPLQYALPGGQDFAKAKAAIVAAGLDDARRQARAERESAADAIKGEQQLAEFYLTPAGSAMAGQPGPYLSGTN